MLSATINQFSPTTSEVQQFGLLRNRSPYSLRLRFLLLMTFQSLIAASLGVIDFSERRSNPDSLAHRIIALRRFQLSLVGGRTQDHASEHCCCFCFPCFPTVCWIQRPRNRRSRISCRTLSHSAASQHFTCVVRSERSFTIALTRNIRISLPSTNCALPDCPHCQSQC